MSQTPNPYEEARRIAKAVSLMFTIDQAFADNTDIDPTTDGDVIADEILELSDDGWWSRMASATNVKPPSATTQAMVVALYRERAQRRTAPTDPFEGLV